MREATADLRTEWRRELEDETRVKRSSTGACREVRCMQSRRQLNATAVLKITNKVREKERERERKSEREREREREVGRKKEKERVGEGLEDGG